MRLGAVPPNPEGREGGEAPGIGLKVSLLSLEGTQAEQGEVMRKERQRSCFGLTTNLHTLHQGHLRMHQRAWSEAQPRKGQGKKCVVLKSVFVSYNSYLFKMTIQFLSLSNVFCLTVTYKGFLPLFKPTVFHDRVSPSGAVRDQLGGDLVASQLST